MIEAVVSDLDGVAGERFLAAATTVIGAGGPVREGRPDPLVLPGTASRRRASRRRRPSARGAWVMITGTGAAASVGLGLLVLATVLISMALPRASLGQRTVAPRPGARGPGDLPRHRAGRAYRRAAAAAAGDSIIASALVLGPLIAPSISLSAITGAAGGAAIRTELPPLVVCAAGLIVISAREQTWAARRSRC
jgi:hypothetical protein